VDVGPAVAAAAAELTRELRARVAQQAPHARVSWTTEGRMHLTLAFIGEVDAAGATRVAQALEEPCAEPAFEVRYAGMGAFPPRGAPRVLWVGVERGREHLRQLEREVQARLRAAGVALEDRPYHPHLTLGRMREPAGLRTASLVEGLRGTDLGIVRVEAITLFESRPTPRGPRHEPVQRTAVGLAGRAEGPAQREG
jgi:2'-5' RNA ligase